MALFDYTLCAVCNCKTFYDSNVQYDVADYSSHAALCKECGKKYRIVVLDIEDGKEWKTASIYKSQITA